MDVRFSAEQDALRASAAQVLDRWGPKAVGQLADIERAQKLDAAIEASGWRHLRVADEDGTPVASGVEGAILAEELGRGLADAPFLGPTLAAELRRLAGAPAAQARETVLLAPGLAGPASQPDGGVAIDAYGSNSALMLTAGSGGYQLCEIAIKAGEELSDLTRPGAMAVGLAIPLVDAARQVTEDDLDSWTALGLALTCADLVGAMRGTLELATAYAGSRKQYGTAIGSFQAVQHLLADALVAIEGSRSVALHAAWAVDAVPPSEALFAASVAKAYCARAARTVCETAIQVHGGIGNTWECMAHVYLRRSLLSCDTLGGSGPNLTRVLLHEGIRR